jgi:hypothetical protein
MSVSGLTSDALLMANVSQSLPYAYANRPTIAQTILL